MVPRAVGRYARGTQRRSALIAAAAELLLEQGLGALSHRAVAARAGLPLASTTYYFRSAEDLRDEAVRHLTHRWAARAAALVNGLPARLEAAQAARAVAGIIGADALPEQLLLMYEHYLNAGRHPRLRPIITQWNTSLTALVQQVLVRAALPADLPTARLVLAVADGAAVTALAEGIAPGDAVPGVLDRLFRHWHGCGSGAPSIGAQPEQG